ncbi:31087_t:CDS:2 [Gigaspora margarita]|uniref:31087_t:CDS:1 n=1 Tax=Gigaspora margarita TaxID=4874 RepID=A0ABM8VY09_GIGMA|nr:31087_t:CDS:2 [Gigaspora margarita]
MLYISSFISRLEKEIHAKLYKEYRELVALFDTNIILQKAAKTYILVTTY